MLKALITVGVLLVCGMIGVVVHHERGKERRPRLVQNEAAEVATISHGECVELADHVPSQGLTIVEFTGEF